MKDKAVIIGSGLGGLECGYLLAKKGYGVTVLEKDAALGGCLQTFRRGGLRFDTGFHYVGALGEGEALWRLFRLFGLLGLPWQRMDPECFDEVSFADGDAVRTYPFACGHERFVERLSELFPSQRAGLQNFASFLKGVGDNIFSPFLGNSSGMNDLFSRPAKQFIDETLSDPLLRRVLSGTNLKMELGPSLPLYVYAQINNSYILSAWRLVGGGSQIADKLAEGIRSFGGRVLTGHEVLSINPDGDRAASVTVRVSGGDEIVFPADWVISDAHPSVTLGMIGECRDVRKIYRRRMSSLADTYGMLTANIALRPGAVRYFNRNLYVHDSGADLWNPDPSRTESVLVHCYPPEDGGEFATHLDIMTPMAWEPVSSWKNGKPGRRGEEYESLKRAKTREAIALVSRRLPELEDAVSDSWTSSPLTWNYYTGTPFGSAYGVRKDWENPMGTVISPRTPLRNLLLTGQSLNLHGILGTSMTAILTCLSVPGLESLPEEIVR